MSNLPTGTVTFLFSDIAGSTRRWETERAGMEVALVRHNAILERAISAHHGHVFHTAGDAYCVSFGQAADAVAAAIDAQRALHAALWDEITPGFEPLRVRMGIHTGLVELKDGDYFGRPVNRVARLMAAGHGGQVLLSLATQQLVRDALPDGARLIDHGSHRLRDLEHTEHLFRLVAPGMLEVDTPPDTAEKLGAGEQVILEDALEDAACPYRGLAAFREEDAAFFFGREVFTARLSDAVAAKPMVGVIGPSGSGKSSVVFAGLLPSLSPVTQAAANGGGTNTGSRAPRRDKEGVADPLQRAGKVGLETIVLKLRPGSQPFHALAGVLVPLLETELTETARLVEVERLATALDDGTLTLAKVIARIREKSSSTANVLLVADQFEELYTLCTEERAQRAFQDLLFDAVHADSGRDGTLKLALTLRADFMGHALAYRPFADAIQDHNVILGPMNHGELTRAIAKPAELQGRSFESGLVERIAEDVGEKAGTLPLLEFALTKLWEEQQGGWLTHEAYERIGRVEGAVARHADAVYERLGETEREGARRVFVQLVQPGEGTEDTRRIATHEELGDQAWALVRRLADSRLVVTNRDEAGRETAEVVHEALIRSWGRLKEWMNGDRRFRAWQERLRFALRQWEATGHDEGALLRGAPLAEAEGWLTERGHELATSEQGFVESSRAFRDQESAQREASRQRELGMERQLAAEQAAAAHRLRQRGWWLAGALGIAAVLAIVAVTSRQQAIHDGRIAFARELAAAATANLEVDPERSTLLALRAISVTLEAGNVMLPEVESVLHRAVSELHLQFRLQHDAQVSDINYSPDGKLVATASRDKTARLWEAGTGKLLFTLKGHNAGLGTAAFSPDGKILATIAGRDSIKLWDTASGKELHTVAEGVTKTLGALFSPAGEVIVTAGVSNSVSIWSVDTGEVQRALTGDEHPLSKVAFSPDGELIALASGSGWVRVLEFSSGRQLHAFKAHRQLTNLQFSPDGRRLLSNGGQLDPVSKLWSVESGREELTLVGHRNTITDAAFRPDGNRVATTSADGTVKLWDAATGNEIQSLVGHVSRVDSVAWRPDGQSLATSSNDGTVRVWDPETGLAILTLRGQNSGLSRVKFSPDGLHLASQSLDDSARIWELSPAHELASIAGPAGPNDIALSPDESRVAVIWADSNTTFAEVADAKTGQRLLRLVGHASQLWHLNFSPDGRRIVTDSLDHTAKIWDATTGELLRTLAGHTDDLNGVAFSPDGSVVATVSSDKSARIWDAESGEELHTLEGYNSPGYELKFSSNGTRMVTRSPAEAVVWDPRTGERPFRMPTSPVSYSRLGFSPNGRYLAAAGSISSTGFVQLWDAQTGKLARDLPLGTKAGQQCLAFTSDGTLIAGGSADGVITIWKVETGELIRTLNNDSEVYWLLWMHDGKGMISLSRDGAAKVWDADRGRLQFELSGLGTGGNPPIISRDGTKFYVGGAGHTLRIILLRLPDLIAVARSRLTRGLSDEECRRYLHVDSCPASP